jgi:CBS domain containing-hemolysin-like protein
MVVNVVRILVLTVIQIVREIVTRVCGWVTTIIRTVREVTEKICKWLPWPINKLCKWVTKTIEILEIVTEWVCEEVIQRIIDWVEVLVEYIFYVLTWICWLVTWPFRFVFDLIWCWMGIKPHVMHTPTSDESVNFTKNQCCIIRTSRYATLNRLFGCSDKGASKKVLSGKSDSGCQ